MKMDKIQRDYILAAINTEQIRRNEFFNVTAEDLAAVVETVQAMHYFGWTLKKAAEITVRKFCAGEHWQQGHLVSEMKRHTA